jgi:hypothetical protein
MHEQHHELPTAQQQTHITPAPDSAASCRVRSPYPASAPGEAQAPGAVASESAGPEPTEGGDNTPSTHTAHRRRIRQPRLREHRVHPRYSDSEFAELASAADISHISIGGYVAEASLAAARAEDPTVKTLMAANRQLGGVGNNLNQLAWHLNKDGAWPQPDTLHRLLERIEAAVEAVDTAVAQVVEGR